MRRLLSFVAFAAWTFAAGCIIPNIYIDVERQAETGILPSEQISVLLLRYRNEGNRVEHLRPIEERFERCIREGMQMVKDDLTFLPSAELRKLVSADTTTALAAYVLDDGTQSPEALLPLLVESATALRPAEEKVRYVVLIVGDYHTSSSKFTSDAGAAGSWGVFGKEWEQISFMQATVLDLKHARVAGAASSKAYGNEGGAVGIVYIIPIPLYMTSMTESRACTNLGKSLARFISGTGTP